MTPAIAHEYEAAFVRKNRDHFEQRQAAEKKLREITEAIGRLDEKYYIREGMTRQKYDLLIAKLDKDKAEWTEIFEKSAVVSSNLAEKLTQASQLCRNLPEGIGKGELYRPSKAPKTGFFLKDCITTRKMTHF